MGVEKKDKLPDAGHRGQSVHVLPGRQDGREGSSADVRLISWEALPRVERRRPVRTGSPGTWYRLKLTVEVGEKDAIVRSARSGSAASPSRRSGRSSSRTRCRTASGAAGLYGYVTRTPRPTNPGLGDRTYDNVVVTPDRRRSNCSRETPTSRVESTRIIQDSPMTSRSASSLIGGAGGPRRPALPLARST